MLFALQETNVLHFSRIWLAGKMPTRTAVNQEYSTTWLVSVMKRNRVRIFTVKMVHISYQVKHITVLDNIVHPDHPTRLVVHYSLDKILNGCE